nr:MAG TPA: hypothetical protein [Caudoviricetes sp.]
MTLVSKKNTGGVYPLLIFFLCSFEFYRFFFSIIYNKSRDKE